jgi:hypothetical protein
MGSHKEATIRDEEWTFTAPQGDEYLYKKALNPRPHEVLPVDMYTIEMSLCDGCPSLAASSSEMKQESLLAHSGEIYVTVKKVLSQSTLYGTNCRGIEDCNRLEGQSMWSQVFRTFAAKFGLLRTYLHAFAGLGPRRCSGKCTELIAELIAEGSKTVQTTFMLIFFCKNLWHCVFSPV